MDFGILDLFKLIGALGFFIYGMKVMSEGIQKAAGNQMRQILSSMTQNRYLGVFTGFLITCLLQSSSATTVMTVSFVNAGLMTLAESAGVMMGANVGTTLTAWLVSFFGFKVKIAAIALPIIAVGFPMLFFKKERTKYLGEFLVGFALLFMGLNELKHAVPDLKGNPELLAFLAEYSSYGILSTLLFIGVGTLLTVIVQSSSAAMALTITMCHQGWIPFEIAAPMVLGENIGTTITAELASIVGNVHAKRSARIHSMFNIIGVSWMIFAHPFYLDVIDNIMTSNGGASPFESSESIPIALSYFHTAFNLSNVILLIWFVPYLVKLAIKMVPSKGEADEQFQLEYINAGLMITPELSILEAKKEIVKMGKLCKKMNDFTIELIQQPNEKKADNILNRIKKYEDITDRMEVEIADYLSKTSQGELTESTSIRVRSMLSMIGDLERIGDIYYQMSKNIERKLSKKVYFIPEQRDNIIEMFKLLEEALDIMMENLEMEYSSVTISAASDIEEKINSLRNRLRKEHLRSIEKGDYNIISGMIYSDLYSSCEKIGDHVINVAEGITGEVA